MSQAATTRYERLQQLRDILTDVLDLEPGELTETSNFVNDHGADSLLAIDIIASIERDMGVHIPSEALPEMINLNAVLGLVTRYAEEADLDA
ncbi:acyl carrier protein [Streptosporangium roseum]|uniref:acyl carrier protein n=1 Tax=Streptosporangium roseum TaxID=2001 RepID=UPI0004CCA6E8|nr:acyl carrier protein [Streptosporangium roseum]